MQVILEYLEDWELHQRVLLDEVLKAKRSVWIATATLKDVHVPSQGRYRSILYQFGVLCAGGVEVRILHGGIPSEAFLRSFKKSGLAGDALFTARRCPRVHLKTIVIDSSALFLGSANLTGAGLGAKGETRRNFESGILTHDAEMIARAESYFRVIWNGKMCEGCGRRSICYVPLEQLA